MVFGIRAFLIGLQASKPIPNCSLSFSRHLGYQASPVSSYQAHFVAWYVRKPWFFNSPSTAQPGAGAEGEGVVSPSTAQPGGGGGAAAAATAAATHDHGLLGQVPSPHVAQE